MRFTNKLRLFSIHEVEQDTMDDERNIKHNVMCLKVQE